MNQEARLPSAMGNTMTIIAFDAIKYMDDLIKVGVPELQAKVQSKTLTHAIEEVITRDLVTKSDLYKVELRLIKWMIAINASMFAMWFAVFKLL